MITNNVIDHLNISKMNKTKKLKEYLLKPILVKMQLMEKKNDNHDDNRAHDDAHGHDGDACKNEDCHQVRGESAMREEAELGPAVNHRYLVRPNLVLTLILIQSG